MRGGVIAILTLYCFCAIPCSAIGWRSGWGKEETQLDEVRGAVREGDSAAAIVHGLHAEKVGGFRAERLEQ